MTADVWGTFSVKDHCWRRPGQEGARLAWEVDWTQDKWIYERSRLEAAGVVSDDAFWSTRRILLTDEEIPGVVEAVAAYPSAAACVEDRDLRDIAAERDRVGAVGAVIARPLFLPDLADESGFRPLKEAVELATDEDFRAARAAYYDWVRDFVAPLQRDGEADPRPFDGASLALAREKLGDLLAKERDVLKRHRRAKAWQRATQAFSIVGLGAAGVGAVAAGLHPPAAVEASAGILGWVTGRVGAPPTDRPPLTGASMFAEPERRLDWLRL